MIDLALSEHNDLIFAANQDLQPVSGIALIDQRIRLRLKIPRGTWVYDTGKTLGSNLHKTLGQKRSRAEAQMMSYVRQALDEMQDITVENVQFEWAERSVEIKIGYIVAMETVEIEGESPVPTELEEFTMTVAL